MNVDMDTDDWLGCPTPLEMYKHQCSILVDELIETQRMLRRARDNIAGLVQMNELLADGKSLAESQLRSVSAELNQAHIHCSEMSKEIMALKMIASQNEHFRTENQRLLMELKVYKQPLT